MMVHGAYYIISVAARLVEMHPQTLRKYERAGLLEPSRSEGNLRLYSSDDIERLLQIKQLVDERGINLAGIELVLSLTKRLAQLDRLLSQDPVSGEQREAGRRLINEMLHELGRADVQTNGGQNGQSHRH